MEPLTNPMTMAAVEAAIKELENAPEKSRDEQLLYALCAYRDEPCTRTAMLCLTRPDHVGRNETTDIAISSLRKALEKQRQAAHRQKLEYMRRRRA